MLFKILILLAIVVTTWAIKRYFRGTFYEGAKENLNGKYALVTGGNSGIGKETARDLLKHGCYVIIGARDTQKSEKVVNQLKQQTGSDKIQSFYLELGSLKSIKQFVEKIKTEKIDILINNAGVMGFKTLQFTESGHELHHGINVVGHIYLTHLLWEKLRKSDYFRIVNLSSITHKKILGFFNTTTMNFEDMLYQKQKYSPHVAYARSKLSMILFTKSIAKMIQKQKGIAVAVHPGVVRSDVLRYSVPKILVHLVNFSYYLFTKNSIEGAQTTLKVVYSDPKILKNGAYYADCQESLTSLQVNDQNCQKFWKIIQQSLGIKFGHP